MLLLLQYSLKIKTLVQKPFFARQSKSQKLSGNIRAKPLSKLDEKCELKPISENTEQLLLTEISLEYSQPFSVLLISHLHTSASPDKCNTLFSRAEWTQLRFPEIQVMREMRV
jgi:hypothetical protein